MLSDNGKRHNLLVVGARPGSLGDAVVRIAQEDPRHDFEVDTAGLGDEGIRLDLTDYDSVEDYFACLPRNAYPNSIICTVGVNYENNILGSFNHVVLRRELEINCVAVINFLHEWWREAMMSPDGDVPYLHHFVAVSSNSAHVARANSLGYCASKAALSMALRAAARRMAQDRQWVKPCPVIYGYEPGWLNDTPMTKEVIDRLGYGTPASGVHRIPGGRGIQPLSLATMIVNNLYAGKGLNGCLLRVDGSEQ